MKIAIALRTCGSVLNYWGSERFVDADKPTIILKCLESILRSISNMDHEVVFSIHDDNSDHDTITKMMELCAKYNVDPQLFHCQKLENFKSQYEWAKQQECDYIYCVEDDYLHTEEAIGAMIDMCERMKIFLPSEYAVYPCNNPHRYASFEMLYPSYIMKGDTGYWRSSFHSTHTFLISKIAFDSYDSIMQFQAYNWPSLDATEDKTINRIWLEQQVKLLCPLDSLAYHLADSTQEDDGWIEVWNKLE